MANGSEEILDGGIPPAGGVVGQTTQSCPLVTEPLTDPPPPISPITIRACMFFDGTGNNRANTLERRQSTWNYRVLYRLGPLAGSYANHYSNVAELETHINHPAATNEYHSFSLYIEGIGTTDHFNDDLAGQALGMGPTGVKSRTNLSISRLIGRIRGIVRNRRRPITIELHSFGFSRGAAAARYFIYQVFENEDGIPQRLRNQLETLGYRVADVTMKFVGLFDTVASLGRSHDDDTADLHLDAVSRAELVVHLASADEHRTNFPLTNVNSAGTNKIEIFLPGVHSDIGGGYTNNSEEADLKILCLNSISNIPMVVQAFGQKIDEVKRQLVASGWYYYNDFQQTWNELTVTRRGIQSSYSIIPLNLMANYAREKGIYFNGTLPGDAALPEELRALRDHIIRYSVSKRTGGSVSTDWAHNDQMLIPLRRTYFHFSAHYGIIGEPMRPQFWSSARGWSDDLQNRLGGQRKRRIYNG